MKPYSDIDGRMCVKCGVSGGKAFCVPVGGVDTFGTRSP